MNLLAFRVRLKTGAIVDASTIDPLSSTTNRRGEIHIPANMLGFSRCFSTVESDMA